MRAPTKVARVPTEFSGRAAYDHLVRALEAEPNQGPVLVLTHQSPDPDALGALVGIQHLITRGFKREATIATRGKIQRALKSPKIREEMNSSVFAYDVLVEPGPIEYDDIREFLRLNQALNLTEEDQRALAEAIHKTATCDREGTGYRESVELLQRGRERGWEQLLRELGGEDEDEDFYDV